MGGYIWFGKQKEKKAGRLPMMTFAYRVYFIKRKSMQRRLAFEIAAFEPQ
jgi:hypothetical protein